MPFCERHWDKRPGDVKRPYPSTAGDRERLEHLSRYVLRPPVAQEALELTADGKILLKMRRAWHDGTRAILFEPHELIARLAALVPRPRINLLLYHGVLGPSARLQSGAVAAARALVPLVPVGATLDISPAEDRASDSEPLVTLGPAPPSARGTNGTDAAHGSVGGSPGRCPSRSEPRPHTSWAELLRRTFEIDVLACPGCGGRVRRPCHHRRSAARQ